jgi:protocatechuate 3,4-dioxygenase beta subunit
LQIVSPSKKDQPARITRREVLPAAAVVGLSSAISSTGRAAEQSLSGAKVCVLTPEAMEGPFYFDPKLVRGDITEGKHGAPLALTLQIVEAKDCAAIPSARVDVWHADGLGLYSGYADQETGSAKGETFLRGTQFTGTGGEVRFTTIYPGWYPGRAPHIHFKVFIDERDAITGQLYFPDPITDHVYATALPYRQRKVERDTLNPDDFIFVKQRGIDTILTVKESGGSYLANLVIGVERNH